MEKISSNIIKQVTLIALIVFIGIIMVAQLKYFIPGFFGAITLYILFRNWCFYLVEKKGWRKWLVSIVIITSCIVLVVLPAWAIIKFLSPRISFLFQNTDLIRQKITIALQYIKEHFPQFDVSEADFGSLIQQVTQFVPKILNATASVITNLAVAFFIFYFMVGGGRKMESRIESLLPLNEQNKTSLWKETQNMVVSNAIGIPVLAACQAVIAAIGYRIFGVDDFIVWGALTGAASIIPVVGTMIVWVPICILTFASGSVASGVGITIYCAVVVSNIDNVLRFTLLKKFGNVHPLITVFGVIIGIQLFGIMGLIFGPLLISYFLLLIQIYGIEFGRKKSNAL